MKPPVWPALLTAIVLTCLAAFFGYSLVGRLRMIASRQVVLKQQLEEWHQSVDGRAHQTMIDEMLEYVTQRAAADAQQQLAALAARTTASLIEQLKKSVESKDVAIEKCQDAFEDEFGRRINLNDDDPPQYDVGPQPTMTSDPLRYGQRMKLWGAAALAVAAYNELVIKSQPDLNRYARELEAQQRVVDEATKRFQELSRRCDDLKSRMEAVLKEPRQHLPSGEEISRRLRNSTTLAVFFGVSDTLACGSAIALAAAVWLRAALIGGWFPDTRIIAE